MKKIIAMVCLVSVILLTYIYMTRYDQSYEQKVKNRVVKHVETKYGKSSSLVVKSYYNDKHRAKDQRYAVAVRSDILPLQKGEYMTYRLKNEQVVEIGIINEESLPKTEP